MLVEGERLGAEDMQPLIEELAVKQVRRLRQFLRARVRNTADVQDIVQEVFLRLLRVPSHGTDPDSRGLHFYDRPPCGPGAPAEVRPRGRLCRPRRGPVRFLPGSEPDPVLEEVTAQQCAAVVEDALRQMAPKPRATFLLYRRDGLSMEEISERLGISRPMAKKYLVKALAHLRQRLKEME